MIKLRKKGALEQKVKKSMVNVLNESIGMKNKRQKNKNLSIHVLTAEIKLRFLTIKQ